MKDAIDVIVCDLDGTLCDVVHRQHLAQSGAWDEFHARLTEDAPRPVVLSLLGALLEREVHDSPSLVFLTGRPEPYRAQTLQWLADHCDLLEHDEFDCLLMRGKDEYGSDTVVKQKLLEDWLRSFYARDEWDPGRVLILDDRDKVVAHFRDLGYECWQVQEGAF